MFLARDKGAPRTSPDAFFPTWSRGWVVGLGVVLIVVGVLATALVLYYMQPFVDREDSGSNRMSFALLAVAVFIFGFGVVCLFRKPTAGSKPGSEKYHKLVARHERSLSRYWRWQGVSILILFPLAVGFVLVREFLKPSGPEASGIFWAAAAIAPFMFIAGVVIWLKGRKKDREIEQVAVSRAESETRSTNADVH